MGGTVAAVMAQMRPEECTHAIRALRAMSASELARALTACDRSQRTEIGRRAGSRLPGGGRVSESQARLIRTELLRATTTATITDALDIITERVRSRTVEVLGDDYSDPSVESIQSLVAELRDEFHDDLVRTYLSLVVDADAVASPLLVPYLADDGPLGIVPVAATEPARTTRRKTSEERRVARTARRRAKAHEKTERREQRETAAQVRRPRRSRSVVEAGHDDSAPRPSTEPVTIEQPRLVHPHVGRWTNVSADSPHRGLVGIAFIPFSGRDGVEGKKRPCVVVASGRKYALLRPLYSYARRHAGGWRAVELREWESAGLEHRSWVGGELHEIRWSQIARVGSLTIDDWNRICRGEVN